MVRFQKWECLQSAGQVHFSRRSATGRPTLSDQSFRLTRFGFELARPLDSSLKRLQLAGHSETSLH